MKIDLTIRTPIGADERGAEGFHVQHVFGTVELEDDDILRFGVLLGVLSYAGRTSPREAASQTRTLLEHVRQELGRR